jgi:hypothetical protein
LSSVKNHPRLDHNFSRRLTPPYPLGEDIPIFQKQADPFGLCQVAENNWFITKLIFGFYYRILPVPALVAAAYVGIHVVSAH